MSFTLFMIGIVLLLAGVAWGMATAGITAQWVMITTLVLLGLGVILAVHSQKQKDRTP